MKAMLIGGAGFVGKHLAIHLANTYGWEIVITGLPEEREAIERSSLGRFIPVNILEKGQIQAVLEQERPHYIFHLAAQSSVARSWKNPQATIDVNIKGCANLLDAIRSVEIYDPKILLIGSGDEYGRLPDGIRVVSETTLPCPGNPYAMTKAAQTMLGLCPCLPDAYCSGKTVQSHWARTDGRLCCIGLLQAGCRDFERCRASGTGRQSDRFPGLYGCTGRGTGVWSADSAWRTG